MAPAMIAPAARPPIPHPNPRPRQCTCVTSSPMAAFMVATLVGSGAAAACSIPPAMTAAASEQATAVFQTFIVLLLSDVWLGHGSQRHHRASWREVKASSFACTAQDTCLHSDQPVSDGLDNLAACDAGKTVPGARSPR